jgi:hypothetical protein
LAPVIVAPNLFEGLLLPPQDKIPADTAAMAADKWQGFMFPSIRGGWWRNVELVGLVIAVAPQ